MKDRKALFKVLAFLVLLLSFDCSKVKASLLLPPDDSIFSQYSTKPVNITSCPDFYSKDYGVIIGIRTGISLLFDPASIGFGYGVNMRIYLSKHWDVELYGDNFITDILNLGYRHDLNCGGSILYYWVERHYKRHKITPFLLAGFCSSDNKLHSYEIYNAQFQFEAWAPWFNLGCGEHYAITKRLDFTVEGLYSLPLSTHPVGQLIPNGDTHYLLVKTKPGFNPGGIFFIFSLNYFIG